MSPEEFLSASFHNNVEGVERYIADGGNVDIVNAKGMSALMLAAWTGGTETARAILQCSPDLTVRQESSGWRALTFAAVNGDGVILRMLFDHGDCLTDEDWKALMFAVQYRNYETTRILLSHGASIEARDEEGRTPLIRAARNSDTVMLSLLLNHGADPNASDADRMTPLMYVAGKARPESVRLLLEHGADRSMTNARRETALDIARAARRVRIVEALEEIEAR